MTDENTLSPGDPEFDAIAARLGQFLDELDVRDREIVEQTEESFRRFCAYAVRTIAARLGYVVQNVSEFVLDMASSFSSGWQAGRQRAREASLRRRQGAN